MTSVVMRAHAELRTRWRAWVSLSVMLGLFGSAAIAIAAGTLSLVALVIGLPIGGAAGRWMWSAFATQLGILPATGTSTTSASWRSSSFHTPLSPCRSASSANIERPNISECPRPSS